MFHRGRDNIISISSPQIKKQYKKDNLDHHGVTKRFNLAKGLVYMSIPMRTSDSVLDPGNQRTNKCRHTK